MNAHSLRLVSKGIPLSAPQVASPQSNSDNKKAVPRRDESDDKLDSRKGGTAKRNPTSDSEAPKKPRGRAASVHSKRSAVVADLMTQKVVTCRVDDSLNTAAQLMWEHNLGALVVVDNAGVPVSMLTDRDICFAAYTQGVPLWQSGVVSAMARRLTTCRSHDTIEEIRKRMCDARLRRIPVVDDDGALVGIISVGDLARELTAPVSRSFKRASSAQELATVVRAIHTAEAKTP